jgi:hypothetical protein
VSRSLLRGLLPLALHALAREVDRAVGLLLHSTLDLPDFVPLALGLLDGGRVALAVAGWVLAGGLAWLLLALLRARRQGLSRTAALDCEAGLLAPLYLRPALTVLAVIALALRPTFPYAFTLPVALTQDWGFVQDAAVAAALVAARAPRLTLPAPRSAEVAFLAFLAYALMVPQWSRDWQGHPGNEPKYLRTAVAAGLWLDLDVRHVDQPMEELEAKPLLPALRNAAVAIAEAKLALARALVLGEPVFDAARVEDQRVAHLTLASRSGGFYHVLAPGPSLLMAPALRADRALNRMRGEPGRLRLTLLLWNALAALLVAAVFVLARDATGRPGLAAAVAAFFAFTPPFLFYFHQFYPELPAALVVSLCLQRLVFGRKAGLAESLALGLLIGFLPWLHQKYLPITALLAAWAVWRAVDRLVPLGALLALVIALAGSAYLTLAFNFALTGSARPDALFLAAGMRGVSSSQTGQGLPGLLVDANYGILPYAPVYLLATGGALVARGAGARLRLALPAALVYYLTVASHDTWTGAISNLGRFLMPLAPLAVAFVAVALDRTASRRGAVTLALTLGAWTAWCSRAFWLDPHAANDATRLLARSAIADATVYLPNLNFQRLADAAARLPPQLLVWTALAGLVALFLRRAAQGRGASSSGRALLALTLALLSAAFVLERWPPGYFAPRLSGGLDLQPGAVAFVREGGRIESGAILVDGREVVLLVRSREPIASLEVIASGSGTLRVRGRAPLSADERGTALLLPLEPLGTFTGRRGVSETLALARVETRPGGVLALRLRASPR